MGMKQKLLFFLEKKNQNGWLKKTEIFNSHNFQFFFMKILKIGYIVSRTKCYIKWKTDVCYVFFHSKFSSKSLVCFQGRRWQFPFPVWN